MRKSQFKAVMTRNLRVSNSLLTLYMAESDCSYPRLGVSVGKSCGTAVVRNRWKRLAREAFRQSQDRIPPGFDYLLIVSPGSATLDKSPQPKQAFKQLKLQQVKDSFLALVAQLREKIG